MRSGSRLGARLGPRPTVAVRFRQTIHHHSLGLPLLFLGEGILFVFRAGVPGASVCACVVVSVLCLCRCLGGPSRALAVLVLVLPPWWPWCWRWPPFCGSVFQSGCRSWRFFPGWAFDLARYTGESEGRSLRQLATRQNERRRSSELSAHHMGSQSSAKVRRTQDLHAERSSNGSCALLRAESSSNGSPPLLGCSCDP